MPTTPYADLPLPIKQVARALVDGVAPHRMGRELEVSQWQAHQWLIALYDALGVRCASEAIGVLVRMGGL